MLNEILNNMDISIEDWNELSENEQQILLQKFISEFDVEFLSKLLSVMFLQLSKHEEIINDK